MKSSSVGLESTPDKGYGLPVKSQADDFQLHSNEQEFLLISTS